MKCTAKPSLNWSLDARPADPLQGISGFVLVLIFRLWPFAFGKSFCQDANFFTALYPYVEQQHAVPGNREKNENRPKEHKDSNHARTSVVTGSAALTGGRDNKDPRIIPRNARANELAPAIAGGIDPALGKA